MQVAVQRLVASIRAASPIIGNDAAFDEPTICPNQVTRRIRNTTSGDEYSLATGYADWAACEWRKLPRGKLTVASHDTQLQWQSTSHPIFASLLSDIMRKPSMLCFLFLVFMLCKTAGLFDGMMGSKPNHNSNRNAATLRANQNNQITGMGLERVSKPL